MIAIAENRNKRILVTGAGMLLLFCAVFCFLTPAAHANIFGIRQELVADLYNFLIRSGVKEMLSVSELVSGIFEDVFNELIQFSQLIGGALVGLIIWVELLKEITAGRYDFDMWFRWFVKMVVGLAFVYFTPTILELIEGVGMEIVNLVSDAFQEGIMQSDWKDEVMATDQGLQVFAAGFIVVYIKLTKYTLIMEIMLRKVFFPVATASIVAEGTRSPGFRYLKKLLAVYLKMAMMIVCVSWAIMLIPDIMAAVPVCLAAIMLMGRLSSVAEEVLGV